MSHRIDVAVLAFGGDTGLLQRLRASRICVFVLVGTEQQARDAIDWGAEGLTAHGRAAGGHLAGLTPAWELLPRVLAIAGKRPVLLAGGIAAAADTRAALDSGACAVVRTRFVSPTSRALTRPINTASFRHEQPVKTL
ncbi:MAG: hypothetical protein QOE41_2488 [Mycobacterium sp.]|nr:oxidoreductase, 2-nitropropane dioxygenase family protein [Mycobacterium sp.]MDT5133177.1 hypothetical protein [Mycobacterium sp.]